MDKLCGKSTKNCGSNNCNKKSCLDKPTGPEDNGGYYLGCLSIGHNVDNPKNELNPNGNKHTEPKKN